MSEGTGTCLRERGRRGLTWIGVVVSVMLLITAMPIERFYQSYWHRLRAMPAMVTARETRTGGRWTPLRDISHWVPEALIATEDRTFYSNLGISFEGIGRSVLVDLNSGQLQQGGSTLTQQLVRNMLLSSVKTFRRKVSEALLATLMTTLYSKREILTLYLNEVYLGDGAYGIFSASERYFGVAPRQLTLPEAALIAGLPQAPTAYDPKLHWLAAKNRQWQVLESMVADHVISLSEAHRIYRAPLPLKKVSRKS